MSIATGLDGPSGASVVSDRFDSTFKGVHVTGTFGSLRTLRLPFKVSDMLGACAQQVRVLFKMRAKSGGAFHSQGVLRGGVGEVTPRFCARRFNIKVGSTDNAGARTLKSKGYHLAHHFTGGR